MFRTTLLLTLVILFGASVDSPAAKKRKAAIEPAAELDEPGKAAVSKEAQQLAKKGMAAFARGDLDGAKLAFQNVLQLAPENPAATINLGLVAYRQKDFTEAERLLKSVVQKKPDAGLAWFILGVICYDQNNLDGALAALAQAALLEPNDARVHHYLGVTVGKKGWYLGAEDEMRKALELDPEYAEAHFNLAVFYLQRNPPAIELARRHYQKALDLGATPDPQVAKTLGQPHE